MKIRTSYEFDQSIDNDIAWRKREFTTLKFMISESRNHEKKILIKAAIALLYSHWEGHVKHCALTYLNYLNNLGYSYNQLNDNFFLLSFNDKFKEGFSIKKFSSQKKLHEYFHSPKNESFNIKETEVIDTESNLKYLTVANILEQLGLDTNAFLLKEHFIDAKMLKCRNAIAHGSILSPEEVEDTYNEIENELLDMILIFQNLVRDAVDNKKFLKPPIL